MLGSAGSRRLESGDVLIMIRLEFMIDSMSYQANVMISSDGTALIADFGNAELRDLTLKFTNSSKLDLSVRWAVCDHNNGTKSATDLFC